MKFEFFEHTADLGVTVYGATREELFPNAAAALYHALGSFRLKAAPTIEESMHLESDTDEELLVAFLSELLFLFDSQRRLFDKIEIQEFAGGQLSAELAGGEIDLSRSEPNYEIKAVTYHQAKIERSDAGWKATLVFDV